MAMAMEPLVEIILVMAVVIMALGLLPLGTEVRSALRLAGLMLAAPGVVLFGVIAYPRETLLCLSAGSVIAGVGWRYAHITRWLAERGARWWTVRIRRLR
jgi:hypothetical protein